MIQSVEEPILILAIDNMGQLPHLQFSILTYIFFITGMSQRIYLGSVSTFEGTVWFTLVLENPTNYHVERYNDTAQAFMKDRLKIIQPHEFGQFHIDGKSLAKVVEEKLQEPATA